jgi:hypothetical protein
MEFGGPCPGLRGRQPMTGSAPPQKYGPMIKPPDIDDRAFQFEVITVILGLVSDT